MRLPYGLRIGLGLLFALVFMLVPSVGRTQSMTTASISPSTVVGGSGLTGIVKLNSPAPRGGFLVQISCSSPYLQTPTAVGVPAGSKSTAFSLESSVVITTHTATLAFTAGVQVLTASVTIKPAPFPVQSLTISPNTVIGWQRSIGKITLNSVAGTEGITVQLSSDSPFAQVPASVTVPHGSTSASFFITTSVVSTPMTATITGTSADATGSISDVLHINPWPIASLTLSPDSVIGGSGVTGTVTLGLRAPLGGIAVYLSSDQASASPTAPTAIVRAGYLTANFRVKTNRVGSPQVANIFASAGGAPVSSALSIDPSPVTALVLNPTSIYGGDSAIGTVSVALPAPAGGEVVHLSSDSTSIPVPATVTIPAGYHTGKFTISTIPLNSTTSGNISASATTESVSAPFTILSHQQIVQLPVNDIAFDSVSGKIWATVNADGGIYANSVVSVDPATGIVGTIIPMGAEPVKIAITDDGQFAYVNTSTSAIERANLQTGLKDESFILNIVGNVEDLDTVPGSPHSYVITGDPNVGVNNVSVWDDTVERQGLGAGGYGVIFAGNDPTLLYGDARGGMYTDTLTPTKINWIDQSSVNITGGVWANNYIYNSYGDVIDPASKSLVASVVKDHFYIDREVAFSTADNRMYFVTWDPEHNKTILVFDATTYEEKPSMDTGLIPGGSQKIIACDNHTIAWFNFGGGPHQLMIVRDLQ